MVAVLDYAMNELHTMEPAAAPTHHRIARGTAWAAAASWGRQILQLVVFLVLARLLGPETYGLLATALIVTASSEVLITDGGWREALIACPVLDPRHLDSVFFALCALGLGLFAAITALAPLLASGFGTPEAAPLLGPLALALPLSALVLVPDALLQRELRFAPLAIASWLALVTGGAVGIGMAVTGHGVWSLVGYHLADAATRCIVVALAAGWRPSGRMSWPHLLEILRFARHVFGESLIQLVEYLLSRWVVAVGFGPAALGLFQMARKVVELVEELLLGALARVALPAFTGLRAVPGRLEPGATTALRLALAVALPCSLGLAVLAPDLVRLALGPAWVESGILLRLLALALLAAPPFYVTRALLQALGRVGWQLVAAALSAALLALLLVGLAPFGLPGIALAPALQALLMAPISLVLVARVSGISLLRSLRATCPTLAAAGAMAAALLAWLELAGQTLPAALVIALAPPLGAAVYLGALALLDRALLREVRAIVKALSSNA
ncbi:oligosaccharide flippase family protein [Falsiroseomonas sp. E2-1-a20]|uniref:oligosaccharide flippase family protein n=1 Tax=Falsiroseomonas sp. E2-1-a20 TaxID=3239300 RepID=UPI003F3E6000